MNARLQRLYSDYQRICDEFTGHPNIDIVPVQGDPPELYRIVYRVTGLRLDRATNRPVRIREHRARMYLHQDYPREKPRCEMETEVFHPNIGPYICLDDYWAAGESISDIIIQIGEMIQYRNYNPRSPLDAIAARWAEQNRHLLPVGHVDLYQPDVDIHLGEAPVTQPAGVSQAGRRNKDDLDIELK